jgi:hypothetical protein
MRTSTILLMLVAAALCAAPFTAAQAQPAATSAATPAFDVAGTDAAKVQAFLKCLQTSLTIDNRMKVASLFSYPVEVSVGGQVITLRNASDLQANYSRVFDAALRQAIASAKVDTLFANAKGVMFDNGRVWFAPVGNNAALKITRINEPVTQ